MNDSKKLSWADVQVGDLVTIEGSDEPMTAWESVKNTHYVANLNRDCPIIRIERPEPPTSEGEELCAYRLRNAFGQTKYCNTKRSEHSKKWLHAFVAAPSEPR